MWRKICHVEKFQIYMHERFGEIWNFSTCGVISNFSTWQMWRNLKFLHSWHVYDVENVLKCVHVMLFCWKFGFVVIYAVCREICFDVIYALLCGEKLNQRLRMWRKNDKYEVCLKLNRPLFFTPESVPSSHPGRWGRSQPPGPPCKPSSSGQTSSRREKVLLLTSRLSLWK